MANHPNRPSTFQPHLKNPIIEALGGLDLTGFNREKQSVLISIDGRPWLIGGPRDETRHTFEGFYRVSGSGSTGPCVAAAFAQNTDAAIKVLAQALVGSNPKKGQIAEAASTIRQRCSVEIVEKKF